MGGIKAGEGVWVEAGGVGTEGGDLGRGEGVEVGGGERCEFCRGEGGELGVAQRGELGRGDGEAGGGFAGVEGDGVVDAVLGVGDGGVGADVAVGEDLAVADGDDDLFGVAVDGAGEGDGVGLTVVGFGVVGPVAGEEDFVFAAT